jgi:hypothetical protein
MGFTDRALNRTIYDTHDTDTDQKFSMDGEFIFYIKLINSVSSLYDSLRGNFFYRVHSF